MSAVEGLPVPTASTDVEDPHSRPGSLPSLCPYLATPDGSWRSASANREHRCTAVNPPVPLTLEKQRRLCLVDAHVGCATYGAAIASRDSSHPPALQNRPVARMTPIILDHGRFDLRMPAIHADRASGQAVLVGVLGVALVAILVARPSGEAGGVTASPSTSAAAPTDAAAVPTVRASAQPTDTPPPTEPPATPSPEPSATPRPSATPSPPPPSAEPVTSGATYKVRSGDTLSAIAARFDTTVRVLVDLNGITDPSRLKVGQVLKLP
jgi:LysM repeat protein